MQPGLTRSIRGNDRGAIAPMYALSLFALVAIAGVGFDVGRMYAMDSELQNAADQAALAAATQLDGKDDSITRAQQAANDYFAKAGGGPYVNETRFAGGERPITALTFQFYGGYADDEPEDLLDASDEDSGAAARIVLVTVNGREMFYALTPIVDAFSSGDITASAMAGIQSATCKVPPLMVCAPGGEFPTDADKGKGVLMQGGAKVGFWEPGDFGYLDLVGGGANGLRDLLGSNGLQDACISNDGTVEAQPGDIANAPNALNTIFDIKPQGGGSQYDCQNNGAFCPVKNTRKDFVRREEWAITYPRNGTQPTIQDCQANPVDSSTGNGNNATSLDVTVRDMLQSDTDHLEGFARDTCHYTNSCGRFGDGTWGRDAYVNNVHAGNVAAYAGLTTRYQIYQKEIELDALGVRPLRRIEMVGPNCPTKGNQPCTMSYTNICAYPQPLNSPAYPFEKDRRVMTVAAANCSEQATENSHEYRVQKWVDIFLVEPSAARTGSYPTGKDQIYGEIIGPAERPGGGFGFQYYGRNKVVLIR